MVACLAVRWHRDDWQVEGKIAEGNKPVSFTLHGLQVFWQPSQFKCSGLWGYSLYSSPYYRLWWRFFFRPRIPLTIAA